MDSFSFSFCFDKSADYIFHLSNGTVSSVTIQEKPSPTSSKDFKSVGDFRKDLNRLKEMRMRQHKEGDFVINKQQFKVVEENILYSIEDSLVVIPEIKISAIISRNNHKPPFNQYQKPTPSSLKPLNPLLDQTVTIIKPAGWIDCISRESKRVFVQDNWIVARILLPPVSKDSVGLKRLSMREI